MASFRGMLCNFRSKNRSKNNILMEVTIQKIDMTDVIDTYTKVLYLPNLNCLHSAS